MARWVWRLTSMAKKRPQLSPDELQQLRWLLGGVLALISAWAVFYLELDAWARTLGVTVAVPVVLLWPGLPAYWTRWMNRLAFPGAVAFFIFDLYSGEPPFPALVKLDVLLLLYRAINYRRRRDDLQLILLGLFLVVSAGVITGALSFGVQIIAFVGCALALLMVLTLVDEPAKGAVAAAAFDGQPGWTEDVRWLRLLGRVRAVSDWRLVLIGGLLFAGVLSLSALLFTAIPRFELGGSMFFDRLMTRKSGSGFTDTLRFGEVTDIQKDNSVAVRVEIRDRSQLPPMPYWRMVVLDEYKEQTFRMSSALQQSAFLREQNDRRVRATEPDSREPLTSWTFYLEPGVGRYLPLLGGFRRLAFADPQTYQTSPRLRLVRFTREPNSMKAYRVDGMSSGPLLRDVDFVRAQSLEPEPEKTLRPPSATMLDVHVSEADRAVLARCVEEITRGETIGAEEFGRRAAQWLGARHRYGLQIAIPPGDGDVVVRWLTSEQPGHCELFAAAFVLLSRTAGHPARVVGGFVGGTWNEDYLMIRNSDAHAWCEIFDGREFWVRMDPTRAAGGGPAADALSEIAGGVRSASGEWSERLDRVRLFWYRRIVNFDRRDQDALVQVLRGSTTGIVQRARAALTTWAERIREWVSQPMDAARVTRLFVGVGIAGAVWAWWRWRGRGSWLRWRNQRGRALDPVRREAGRWLQQVSEYTAAEESEEFRAVRAELERLRYGANATWPDAAATFRRARKVLRVQRRRARETTRASS
jgi:protein-glutamine gamma-glutamyltransferase